MTEKNSPSIMRELMKALWRITKRGPLKKKNVKVHPKARFNHHTFFEGNNVVLDRAVVSGSHIGRNTYICADTLLNNCHIGRFCSIGSGVQVVTHTHPSSGFVSTSPSFFSVEKQNGQTFVNEGKFEELLRVDGYNLIVGNDVWIGMNAMLKGGIRIGDGAIVAMGAIVTKDVPPYAIVGGVPARIIRYRFSQDEISRLLDVKWWDKPDEWLRSHADAFENIEAFLQNV